MDAANAQQMRQLGLAFGRRLLGSGELVPPGVYLDLGDAFLADDDAVNAEKTFSRASDLPDYAEFQRKVAGSFEKAGFLRHALRVYQRVLISRANDTGLLAKVGELHEQLGEDERAFAVYGRAVRQLLQRRPLSVDKGKKKKEDENKSRFSWWQPRNVDEYGQNFPRVERGYLATAPDDPAVVESTLDELRKAVESDLAQVPPPPDEKDTAAIPPRLEAYPRIRDRAAFHRRLALAFNRADRADDLDLAILATFARDDALLEQLCRGRIGWGLVASARGLVERCDRPEKAKKKLRYLLGESGGDGTGANRLPISEAARLVLGLCPATLVDATRTATAQRTGRTGAGHQQCARWPHRHAHRVRTSLHGVVFGGPLLPAIDRCEEADRRGVATQAITLARDVQHPAPARDASRLAIVDIRTRLAFQLTVDGTRQ